MIKNSKNPKNCKNCNKKIRKCGNFQKESHKTHFFFKKILNFLRNKNLKSETKTLKIIPIFQINLKFQKKTLMITRGKLGTLAWTKNTKLGVDVSLMVANYVSIPREFFDKISDFFKEFGRGQRVFSLQWDL